MTPITNNLPTTGMHLSGVLIVVVVLVVVVIVFLATVLYREWLLLADGLCNRALKEPYAADPLIATVELSTNMSLES